MMGELEQNGNGIPRLRKCLDAFQSTGARIGLPTFLGMLAELAGKAGRPEEGLDLIAEALDIVAGNGEGVWLAELLLLKGKLSLMAGANTETSERCFQDALEAAHRQDDRCFELRATTSLAHLWQKQGELAEARDLLSPIYGWFTEGFDTPDLVYAKALLQGLASR